MCKANALRLEVRRCGERRASKAELGVNRKKNGFSRMKFPVQMQFLCKLPVEAKEKDGYFIFVQKDTEFKGEWNKEHTIYTNANFVEIPKEVYDEIGTQVEQKGKKLEKYINFFYQCDIDWYLPVDIRYQGNLYRMYLFQDMNNNYYKKSLIRKEKNDVK